jgi:hypothetical protein
MGQKQRRCFCEVIAVVQVLWLIIQTISRAAEGLPISQIEVSVLAYSTCAVFTYGLWWHKPQNVGTPTFAKKITDSVISVHSPGSCWFTTFLLLPAEHSVWNEPTIPNDVTLFRWPFLGIFARRCGALDLPKYQINCWSDRF